MKQKNIIKKLTIVLLGIVFALSSSMLSFELIINDYYTKYNIIITCIISFICAIIYYYKTYKNSYSIIKKEKILFILSLLLSTVIIRKLYLTKAVDLISLFNNGSINPFELKFFILSYFSLFYILFNVLHIIKHWYINFYNGLDKWEKKAYLITSTISLIIIIILYSTNTLWFLQYDKFYSIDSGDMFSIIQSSIYYDIRHPLFNILTFPIFSITTVVSKLLAVDRLYKVIIGITFQFINCQLLIFIGLFLKKLTNKKIVYILYMISFPTVLHLLFLEKYQICVFFIVLYVYTLCTNKEKSIPSLIAAAGAMITSAFIGLSELLVKSSFKDKLKKILLIIVIAILTIICLGRAHMLVNWYNEVEALTNRFTSNNLTLIQRIISTFKMIQNCFIALPSYINERGIYTWYDLYQSFSLISIIIVSILIIGIFAKRKNLLTKINTLWLIFSFILFVIIKWSCHESALFSIYFSWAIIPLFIDGVDYIIEKLKLDKKNIYALIILFVIIVNSITFFDIYRYINLF